MQQLFQHWRGFKQAWLAILRTPFEHLINILVLGLIITICAAALALNNNLHHWQKNNVVYPQMVLYLDNNANQADITDIEKVLNKLNPQTINDYQFISKQQALNELRQDQQFKNIASDTISASENPLPDVIIVNTKTLNQTELEHLNLQLSQLPMVNKVQLDLDYANKLNDLFNFTNQVGLATLILFILVLSLVVYNMIRLQMLLNSNAIHVSRLIGASNSFIMRPLIHYAFWQLSLACLLAFAGLSLLTKNLNTLFSNFNHLFGQGFQLTMLPWPQFALLWLILVIFTCFTVFIAVRWIFRHAK